MTRIFFSLFILVWSVSGIAQFRHMHYNLTLYGNPYGCDETSNSTEEKDQALRTIIEHVGPHLFTVNELRDLDYYADRILDEVLNEVGEDWARAELSSSFTTSSIVNGFYYRSDRFSLYDHEVVYEDLNGGLLLRPIDFFHLYAYDIGLVEDSIAITCIVAHLAASDPDEREDQTEAMMAHIATLGPRNYIFAGDLNMDSAWEEAYQNMISYPEASLRLYDPVSTASQWHNNSSVAQYHTQSTRYGDTNNGCFAGGGLDDRFDITLLSSSILEGTQGVSYVPGSYHVLGQSGNDYNQELQITGNPAVPVPVAQALYDMSDHLPVVTDFDTEVVLTSVQDVSQVDFSVRPADGGVWVITGSDKVDEIWCHDIYGRFIYRGGTSADGSVYVPVVHAGVYVLTVVEEVGLRSSRKIVISP